MSGRALHRPFAGAEPGVSLARTQVDTDQRWGMPSNRPAPTRMPPDGCCIRNTTVRGMPAIALTFPGRPMDYGLIWGEGGVTVQLSGTGVGPSLVNQVAAQGSLEAS